jgi:hypothetical protein
MNANHSCRAILALSQIVLLASLAPPALALWPPNGIRIDAPTYATSFYRPQINADASGGLLVGFGTPSQDCSRVLEIGSVASGWPVTLAPSFAWSSAPVPDGHGGAYVAGAYYGSVRLRHLRPNGSPDPAWPSDGIEVCSAPGFKYAQAAFDPAGGAYVVWCDGRNAGTSTNGFPRELYGTRVLADGSIAPGWSPQGTLLAATPDSVVMVLGAPLPDGEGGMLAQAGYAHDFLGYNRHDDLFLVHVEPDGSLPPGWPAGGLFPSGVPTGNSFLYEPDGSGGVFVGWSRPEGSGFGGRVQRLLSSGATAPGWPSGGVNVLASPGDSHYIKAIAADGEGGVFVGIARDTVGDLHSLVHQMFRIGDSGAPAAGWPANGRRLPIPPDASWIYPVPLLLARDAHGGVFAAWAQTPDANGDFRTITALRIGPSGETGRGWPDPGLTLCDTTGGRRDLQLVSDGDRAAYAVWRDHRVADPSQLFTYASRLELYDVSPVSVGPQALGPEALRAGPNPFAGSVELSFTLAAPGEVRLVVLDVSGRVVRPLALESFPAGMHTRSWDGKTQSGSEAPPGLYFVRGRIGTVPVSARVVRVR